MGTISIEIVKGMRVTPIVGAYYLPTKEVKKIRAETTWYSVWSGSQ